MGAFSRCVESQILGAHQYRRVKGSWGLGRGRGGYGARPCGPEEGPPRAIGPPNGPLEGADTVRQAEINVRQDVHDPRL
eukprot:9482664-Pyramimonas_sp.AAC.2